MKRKKTKFEELLATEIRGQDISADEDLALERKLAKKLKVKRRKLLGDDDDMNNLFEGIPSLLDSFEDENTQLVGEARRKRDKSSSNERSKEKRYNKEAQGEDHDQEEEQKADSTPYCTDVKAAAGSAAKENAKYVTPCLRMSEANVESITSEISTIYQTVGRTFGSQIFNEEVLASCSRGPRGNEQLSQKLSGLWTPQGWNLMFRRALNDWEVGRVADLLHALNLFPGTVTESDKPVWRLHSRGVFTVKSCYWERNTNHFLTTVWPWKLIWKIKIATDLWNMFVCILGVNWTMPRTTFEVLTHWQGVGKRGSKEDWWKNIPACIWWTLWKERNGRCFEGKVSSPEEIKMRCLSLLYFW
ncbi:hypothetical protein H5410_023692 [Solanum commersonii]|uniref:Uncharacterized protein n=1 Tax=Solanum commersonii TaxID=4109 RepID=A0A9J5ZHK9_SOLCO|nr:hypothetical protein H5410_023692 [Solanum commersonii]